MPSTCTSAALQLTRQLAQEHSVEVRTQALNLNDLASTLVSGARYAHQDTPPHIYARFLFEAIEPDTRQNFFRWAEMIQRRGGLTFLEFRTGRGAPPAKVLPFYYRAVLDADRIVAQIEQHGGSVVQREEGVGLAPFEGEDPHTCRLVVRWT